MGVPRVYLSAHLCQISIVMSMNMCNCAVRAAAGGCVVHQLVGDADARFHDSCAR